MTTLDHNYLAEENKYKDRLSVALKAAKICVFEVDLTKRLYTFFENAEDIFGVSGEDILKDVQPYSELPPEEYQLAASQYFSHPDDSETINNAFVSISKGEAITYEARMKAGNSKFIWCRLAVTPIMEDGLPVKMIGVITDISNIKQKTDLLEEKVKLDSFTGLYNKNFSVNAIKYTLKNQSRQQHAILVLDIDNFKHFNDNYGHFEGDTIIKATADLLVNSFRKSDIIGRFGGDEFIVMISDFTDLDWIYKKLSQLTNLQVNEYSSTNSIGVAIYPQDGTTLSQLFKKADKALYYSKKKKGTFTFFSDNI